MSNNTIRSKVEKQARSAIIQYALFRWESAMVIGLTILLMFFLAQPFPGWPIWGWPVLGGLGLVAIIVSSLTDAEANARALQELYQAQFNPRKVLDPQLRREIEQALEYQQRIETHTRKQRAGVLRDRLEDTASQLADWVGNIYKLCIRLDAYRHDPLLAQERASVPKELDSLKARLEIESNSDVRQGLQQVIDSKNKQLDSLRALHGRMKQAELQLEQSLTALATVYSQVQLVDAQDVESGRSERLREDIMEQVARLNDLVESINEVYDYQR
ncbi:MAG: DUF3309 domain-containing protein [Anaerolineae bacterium]|nr:DUF3309 domain-containing protein [Anaerolineae bacterium]